MSHAVLRIGVPERVWIGDLSRRYAETTFRILSAFPDGSGGIGMVEIESPELDAVLETMGGFEEVTALELLGRSNSESGSGSGDGSGPGDESRSRDEALVQFDTADPLLLVPLRESGTLLDFPFEVRAGEAVWEVTATHDRLSALGEQLRELGIEFDVESITREVEVDRLLTERQLRLVQRAVEAGYYDTPRTCTLTELAGKAGVAKSTASETLHRAEGRIVKEFVAAGGSERVDATYHTE